MQYIIIRDKKAPNISALVYPKVFLLLGNFLIIYRAIRLHPKPDKSENK